MTGAEVPPAVRTVTGTGPAACAGLMAWIDVADWTANVAGAPPNDTDVAPVNPVPLIVTGVPPAVGPVFGVSVVTTGGRPVGRTYLNRAFLVSSDRPALVTTRTRTVPGLARGGATTTILRLFLTRTLRPFFLPNRTFVTCTKFLPLILTTVPPVVGPEAGLTFLTTGLGRLAFASTVASAGTVRSAARPWPVAAACTGPATSAGTTSTARASRAPIRSPPMPCTLDEPAPHGQVRQVRTGSSEQALSAGTDPA